MPDHPRLLCSPCGQELFAVVSTARTSVDIAVAYVGEDAASALLDRIPNAVSVRFVARCNPRDLAARSVDPRALRLLAGDKRVALRVMPDLHAKVYLTDSRTAVIGSANLTKNGLGLRSQANEEMSIVSGDQAIVSEVRSKFSQWWHAAREVRPSLLEEMIEVVESSGRLSEDMELQHQLERLLDRSLPLGEPVVFPFQIGKSFLNRSYGHPITIPKEYNDDISAGVGTNLSALITCPDGSVLDGRIRSGQAGYGLYYQVQTNSYYAVDPFSNMKLGDVLSVTIAASDRPIRVDLKLVS